MRILIIVLMLIVSGSLLAQNGVNQVDAQGRKQGFWSKKDQRGRLIYQATFKDDQPVGEMKRFHPNGKIKALMNFTEGSQVSDAKLFDESGHKIAEGKYLDQKKTGEWNYFVNDKIISTENFENGEKNGPSKRWFSTGQLLEEASYKNGQLNGMYRTYFQNGKVYLECKYNMGQKNGPFKTFFTDGTLELDAFYTNDRQDKSWLYYNEKGDLLYTLKYDKGILLNPEVQDSINAAQVDAYKTREENIPDPDKYRQNPEEYMKLMEERKGK